MRLAVFGATGATGRQLVKLALAAGNHVVAFARDASRVGLAHERLAIVVGELSDSAAIEKAVSGTEAVISVLGPRPGKDSRGMPLSTGMKNIIASMGKLGTRRLVITSTPSAADPQDLPDPRFSLLIAVVKTLLRPAYDEIVNVARLVWESDTDWTIVRVTMLTNGSRTGTMRAGFLGRKQLGTKISRADLAACLLDQVNDTTWMRKAPAVSN
jgi:putative NADH-flavin reductase